MQTSDRVHIKFIAYPVCVIWKAALLLALAVSMQVAILDIAYIKYMLLGQKRGVRPNPPVYGPDQDVC